MAWVRQPLRIGWNRLGRHDLRRVMAALVAVVLSSFGFVLQAGPAFAGGPISGVVSATLSGVNISPSPLGSGAVTLDFQVSSVTIGGTNSPLQLFPEQSVYVPDLVVPTNTNAATVTISFSGATVGTTTLEGDSTTWQSVEDGPVGGTLTCSFNGSSGSGGTGGYGGTGTYGGTGAAGAATTAQDCMPESITVNDVELVTLPNGPLGPPNSGYPIYTPTPYGTATASAVASETGVTFTEVACQGTTPADATCVATGTSSQGQTEQFEYQNGA